MRDEEVFRRRHLPHWDVLDGTYFVTACLKGSVPAIGLLDLKNYRKELTSRERPPELSAEEWELRLDSLEFARADEWLDVRPAVSHLADERLAATVRDALFHFAGKRYDLLAYVVMSSHIHWIFRPLADWISSEVGDNRSARESICHSIKRHTALACNRILEIRGSFWQDESYDHWVRDFDELIRCIEYVENNPVKAGLVARPEDWSYSSARDRMVNSIKMGEPLRP